MKDPATPYMYSCTTLRNMRQFFANNGQCFASPRQTQPPTLSRTGNEYRPKCDDGLRLGLKADMAYSICGCTCGWQVKLRDPSLTRVTVR